MLVSWGHLICCLSFIAYWKLPRSLKESNSLAYNTVQYAESQRIATITFNRADKRNAITYELMSDMAAALKQAASSSAQVVILTGAGKAFCAGMDLENLKQLSSRTHEQ